jgi:hypothetical protein
MAGLCTALVWALVVGGTLGVLVHLVPGIAAFVPVRAARDVAIAVACLTTPVLYLLLALGPKLPKRLLMPLCWTVAWSLAGAMPVLLWAGMESAGAWVSAAYVVVGLAALLWLRDRTGRWGMSHAWLARRGPRFALGHLAVFTAAHAVVVPLALALYMAGSAWITLPALSGGYVEIRSDGLYVRERILASAGQRVRLIGMIHIGDPEFYGDIARTIAREDDIVLREGVTDREGRLGALDYSGLAGSLGLATQQSELEIASATTTPYGGASDIPYSDVDASELSSDTLKLLTAVAGIYRDPSAASVLAYLSLALDGDIAQRAWADIVTFRNERVLRSMDAALERFDHIAIPWGALHMPGIEAGVAARGFTPIEDRLHRAIAFDHEDGAP